jgi:acyl-coenzyme A thioesterase PaaI-like protein
MSDYKPGIFTRLGIRSRRDPSHPLSLRPFPAICAKGVVRPSVLVLAVDMMAGFHAEAGAGTDWVFTTDLSLRCPARHIPEQVVVTGRPLRVGRGTVSADVELIADGKPYAYGQSGFVRIPRRHGDPPQPHLHSDQEFLREPPIEEPLALAVGIQIIDPALGHCELALRDELLNPARVLQGAIVSLIAEVAAESLAEHTQRRPQLVTEIDIRYLAMGRVGPIASHAWWIGEPGSGAIRVELRDRGNDDRLTTAVLARCEPA